MLTFQSSVFDQICSRIWSVPFLVVC